MAKIRNPLLGLALVLLEALGLSAAATAASLLLPYMEFRLFFLGFALFGAGVVAGREIYVGGFGFAGAYLGAFAGLILVQSLFWTNDWMYPIALVMAAACGLGGLVSGKLLGGRRLDQVVASKPRVRRCERCGARVGLNARKCWSCRAMLTS